MAEFALVERWLSRLGRVTVASLSKEDADAWVEDMAPLLAEQFPDWVFCQRSLSAVAAECRHLPMFGQMVDLLRNWRQSVPDDAGAQQRLGVRSKQEREREAESALQAERRESWRDPQAVRDRVRMIESQPDVTHIDGVIRGTFKRTLVAALRANAPQHLGLLPPSWLEEGESERREAKVVPIRQSAQLSPEQLAEVRQRAAAAAFRPEVKRGDA